MVQLREELVHFVPRLLFDLRALTKPCRIPTVVVTAGASVVVHVLGDTVEQPPSCASR